MLETKFQKYMREQIVELLAAIDTSRKSFNPELEQVVQRVLIQQAENHCKYTTGSISEREMI